MPVNLDDDYDELVLKVWPKRLYFVLRCHFMTLLMILVGSCHLYFVTYRQQRIVFFKMGVITGSTYCLLYYTAFSFWIFVWLCYFRKLWHAYSWWIKIFVTFLMAWLSVPLMWLPLISAQVYEWYIATFCTMGLMGLHTILAMFREPFYNFTAEFLMKWTIRGFMMSALGIVASIAWKSSQTDVVIAVIILTSQTVLIIIFGRTIGSDAFFEKEIDPNEYLFMILTHYNFISWFSHIVLALCKIRCVLQPYKTDKGPQTNATASVAKNVSWVEDFSEVENFEYTY